MTLAFFLGDAFAILSTPAAFRLGDFMSAYPSWFFKSLSDNPGN
eukprot:CAMPEP_0202013268 /NCGR_PEP_ID=MMETSP0905-20130828/25688_1 /ASSEMBLY_ACC=CAM_ASM_000554 /TAXON_ID=420261 /ORGANISM="Thalassiosira antarctica, Strain CCMP982" /LENGTH=43 /DNA_ID= /DNA_START= /DNA_END= /DNA_ORIENTATION=